MIVPNNILDDMEKKHKMKAIKEAGPDTTQEEKELKATQLNELHKMKVALDKIDRKKK